jgi:hypothetical protein
MTIFNYWNGGEFVNSVLKSIYHHTIFHIPNYVIFLAIGLSFLTHEFFRNLIVRKNDTLDIA